MKCPNCKEIVKAVDESNDKYSCENDKCPIWIFEVTARVVKPEQKEEVDIYE